MCRILGQSLARAPAAIKRSHGAPATGENTAGIGRETEEALENEKKEKEEEEEKKRQKSAGVRREDGLSAYFKDKPAHPIAPGRPHGHQP